MKITLFILLLFICAPFALFGDEITADTTQEQVIIVEDIQDNNAQEEISLNVESSEEEITKENALSDSLLNTESHQHSHTKLTIIRRDHDYKRQAWMAIGMMTFVVIILGTSQTWNPR